jgi:hypothetical protein
LRSRLSVLALLGLVCSLSFAAFDGHADTRQISEEEFNQCIRECTDYFVKPGAGFRACVASCQIYHRQPLLNWLEENRPQICETYEPDCDRL